MADGTPPTATVESSSAASSLPSPAAGTSLPQGGKQTSTPEQRERWRNKKRLDRLKRKAAAAPSGTPPPLPPTVPPPLPAAAPTVESAPLATPVSENAVPASEIAPVISWSEAEVSEIVAELIETLEEWDKADDVKKARAVNIGGKLLDTIEADAGIPKFCKVIWKKYLPKLAVKWLNKSGISGEYDSETAIALSVLYYIYDKSVRSKEIKKLAQPTQAQPVTP
jgi:hypothetical protein